jgi:hypothetical protein
MYNGYKGQVGVRFSTETYGKPHLVDPSEPFSLVLSNTAAVLDPPDPDSVSGDNVGCRGGREIRAGEEWCRVNAGLALPVRREPRVEVEVLAGPGKDN